MSESMKKILKTQNKVRGKTSLLVLIIEFEKGKY
jgi:hypothetical protein